MATTSVARKGLKLGGEAALDPAGYATATNGACAVVLTPAAGRAVMLKHVLCGYSAAPTGGLLTVSSARGVLRRGPITAAGLAPVPLPPWVGNVDEVITVTLAAGGVGVVGYLNVDADNR